MSIRYALLRCATELKFRIAGARIDVHRGAQIRSPRLRPKKGGTFVLGASSIFAGRMAMDRENAVVRIGERSFVGNSLLVAAQSIEIGDDTVLSWGITIVDHQSHGIDFAVRAGDVTDWLTGKKNWSGVTIEPVRIGNKVWIGFGASILPGVTVGEGAVVGAASVVTRDVEPWTVVAGNPATVIRQLEPSA
jgi:galactoside O-acetyltransferase